MAGRRWHRAALRLLVDCRVRVQADQGATGHQARKKRKGVLFYWGVSEGRRLRQARALTKKLHEAFFLAPPPKPPEHEQELVAAHVFHQQGDRFQVDDIRPFLLKLGWMG